MKRHRKETGNHLNNELFTDMHQSLPAPLMVHQILVFISLFLPKPSGLSPNLDSIPEAVVRNTLLPTQQ